MDAVESDSETRDVAVKAASPSPSPAPTPTPTATPTPTPSSKGSDNDSSSEKADSPEPKPKPKDKDKDRQHPHKRRKRRRLSAGSEMEMLDDDFALINENLGYTAATSATDSNGTAKKKKTKRLRRAVDEDESDADDKDKDKDKDNGVGGGEGDAENRDNKVRAKGSGLGLLFARDDESDSDHRGGEAGVVGEEMDDFIVDDSDGSSGDERRERGIPVLSRSIPRAGPRGPRGGDSSLAGSPALGNVGGALELGVSDEAWQDIVEIFGDGSDYDWALDITSQGDSTSDTPIGYAANYEPAELTARLMTEADDIIRAADIPERLQLRIPFNPPIDGELVSEAAWIAVRLTADAEIVARGPLPPPTTAASKPAPGAYVPFGASVQALAPTVPPHVTSDWPWAAAWIRERQSTHDDEARILSILTLLRVENLEIAFIHRHRKDACRSPCLPLLWKIHDLDLEFQILSARKTKLAETWARLHADLIQSTTTSTTLTSVIPDAAAHQDIFSYADFLPSATSIDELNDFADYLRFYFGAHVRRIEATPQALKRRVGLSLWESAHGRKIDAFSQLFEMDPFIIVESCLTNLSSPFASRTPSTTPLTLAQSYTDTSTSTPATLLKSTRALLAARLGVDPKLRRFVRKAVVPAVRVSVAPTSRGKLEIDETHPYYRLKYVSRKPLRDFAKDDWVLLCDAEEKSLLTFNMHIDNLDAVVLRHLDLAALADTYADIGQVWNDERRLIIRSAVEDHILPALKKQIKDWMKGFSEEWVVEAVRADLEYNLRIAPLAPFSRGDDDDNKKKSRRKRRNKYDDEDADEYAKVLAISWGDDDPMTPCVGALVSPAGEVIDTLVLHRIKSSKREDREDDRKNLKRIIETHEPNAVVIAGYGPSVFSLKLEITSLVEELNAHESRDDPIKVRVDFANDQVARIYMHSKRSEHDFPNLNPLMRYCVSLARGVQDPLAEYATLWTCAGNFSQSEIMKLKLHPSQAIVHPDKLASRMQRAFLNVVTDTGVDLIEAIHKDFKRNIIQFIAGIGPRKAQTLIQKICRKDEDAGKLKSRAELITLKCAGACVFINMASFIRIRRRHFRDPDEIDVLDDTRIHPEEYELARKMATDALEVEDMGDEEDVNRDSIVEEVMGNADALNFLMLEDYATQLEIVYRKYILHALTDIRNELVAPHKDFRSSYHPPSDSSVFAMLTGESDSSFKPGMPVNAVVKKSSDSNTVFCKLTNGLDAVLQLPFDANPAKYQSGKVVQLYIDVITKSNMRVSLTTEHRPNHRRDDYWDNEREREDQAQAYQHARDKTNPSMVRNVSFKYFKDVRDFKEAEDYLLKTKSTGYIVRNSRNNPDKLVVAWRVHGDIFQHFDIDYNSRTGLVQVRGEKFSSLEEMDSRYMQPMLRNTQALVQMRDNRFVKAGFVAAERAIQEAFREKPKQGHWRASFASEEQGKGQMILIYRSKMDEPTMKEPIQPHPKGYMFRKQVCRSLEEVIRIFKLQPRSKEFQTLANPRAARLSKQQRPPIPQPQQPQQQQLLPGTPYAAAPPLGGYVPPQGPYQQYPQPPYNPYAQPPNSVYSNSPLPPQQQHLPPQSYSPAQQQYPPQPQQYTSNQYYPPNYGQ